MITAKGFVVPAEGGKLGGLMSYGAIYRDYFERAAILADKIIRGVKTADLPVEQPTRFEPVINLKTAKRLGLAVSQTLLSRAPSRLSSNGLRRFAMVEASSRYPVPGQVSFARYCRWMERVRMTALSRHCDGAFGSSPFRPVCGHSSAPRLFPKNEQSRGSPHQRWTPMTCDGDVAMLVLRLAMIQHEPAMTRKTISRPKARANTLFVWSGPVPMCRKKTR